MASAGKEDGTEAVAAISLGGSAERNVESKKDADTKNDEAPAKLCSACGKKSDTVKKCTACKCVWYCDTMCQKKRRKEHIKECKRIKKWWRFCYVCSCKPWKTIISIKINCN